MMEMNDLTLVDTTWEEFLPINQNLYMPTNFFDYQGAKLMPLIKHLPISVKNIIYQNGFFNPLLNRVFNVLRRIIFGRKHKRVLNEKKIKALETLKYLKS